MTHVRNVNAIKISVFYNLILMLCKKAGSNYFITYNKNRIPDLNINYIIKFYYMHNAVWVIIIDSGFVIMS